MLTRTTRARRGGSLGVPGTLRNESSRALDRRAIFGHDAERRQFLGLVALAVRRHGWRCLAWCLMTNHYLVLRAPEPTLPAGMQLLNGEYARWFNRRHGRHGHVFGAPLPRRARPRRRAVLEAACRYVVLDTMRAGLCASPGEWRWSS